MRIAVLVANTVSSQPIQKGLPVPRVRKTAEQLANVLQSLPAQYAFQVRRAIDKDPAHVQQMIAAAAHRCKGVNDLFLVYYFGHGLRVGNNLAFVHPGPSRDTRRLLKFETLWYKIRGEETRNALFLLDCCYAGAAAEHVAKLPEQEYCLIASTSPSTRSKWAQEGDSPIGKFTSHLLNALFVATEKPTNDVITAKSVSDYIREKLAGVPGQSPFMSGALGPQLSAYSKEPVIVRGVTEDVSPKAAYCKLHAIVSVLGHRRYDDLRELYSAILTRHRDAFLTNYRDEDERTHQRPAKWTVLRRYIGFLRNIQVIADDEDVRLTARGLELRENDGSQYNQRLLVLLDRWLNRVGLPREKLREIMLKILDRRWVPTRANVLSEVALQTSLPVSAQNLGLALDLYGYIGIFGLVRRREQVYFPWGNIARGD